MTSDISQLTIDGPFAHDLSVALSPTEAEVAVALPFEDRNTMFGVIHGGALASLVPISTFAAVRTSAPAAELCTVSLHLEYVRAARKPVVAETRTVRRVRELEFFETRINDSDGNAIAFATAALSQGGPPSAAVGAGPARDPLDSSSPDVARAIQDAIAASPYLSRRQVSLTGSAPGTVALHLTAAPVNLDRDGRMHEGAAMTLIDAAGATCPYTIGPATGAGGATIALHVQILGPLPLTDLIARATIRARSARLSWVDVSVVSVATGELHALGTVVYRFNERSSARS
jgi:uncharacterized protein (TIGR00369 family)